MNDELRTFPIRVAPLPGEALDSWFEALAHRLHVTLGELLPQLGLSPPKHSNKSEEFEWTVMLQSHEIERIARVSGLDPNTVTAMTLACYDERALLIDPVTGRVRRRVIWGRGGGSRYCPSCLSEDGGRWQLTWRLGWSFACARHSCLLADACPGCGRMQRYRPHPRLVPVQPGHCPNPGKTNPRRQRCGADLREASCLPLTEGHPALLAQQYVWKIIRSDTVSFGIYASHPVRPAQALADLKAIAARALADASADELTRRLPDDLLTDYHQARAHVPVPRGPGRAEARPGFMAPSHAVVAAAGVTAAADILAAADIRQAGRALRWLTTEARQRGMNVTASNVGAWGKDTTPPLLGAQLVSLEDDLQPMEHLRYRTAAPLPSHPARDPDRAHALSRSTPSQFWPSWAARLSPGKTGHSFFRAALSICVLLTGTRLDVNSVVAELGVAIPSHDISRILALLGRSPNWPQISAALTRFADHVVYNPPPIDYRVRRSLDYSDLLPDEQWEAICRTTGASGGQGRRAMIARAYLFSRLSGLPGESAPAVPKDTRFRNDLADFTMMRFPELAAALDEAGRDFLARHGITSEPVVWQPSLSMLDDLALPGHDVRLIDVSELHQLLLGGRSPSGASAELGTSLAVVRCLLDASPLPARHARKGEGSLPGPSVSPVNDTTKDALIRLCSEENLAFTQISQRLGIRWRTFRKLAKECGIDVPRQTTPSKVSREWLYEQHVIKGHTLVELAKSAGLSSSAINKWARAYSIPANSSVVHSPELRGRLDVMPALLKPALTGYAAWKRLQIFASLPDYPDLTSAARALHLNPRVMWEYLNQLEDDLSGRLLERSSRGRRTKTPTTLGQEVIKAVREIEYAINTDVNGRMLTPVPPGMSTKVDASS
ncbi:TniQ family protein [Streptomyces marispadix]|uniref:TniQ family protein n=1 Tax=Streptomyces marispadix TaxID=2922868 RepID=A0ABS9SYX8_9ACTN|nr:TniQ family protein [Streptomyces marispadix]MCH6161476.1 TniQ family protein [Streptomyces marispadix]